MQFLLVAPAKAYIVPMTKAPRFIDSPMRCAVWDNLNVYVKTGGNPRMASTESQGYNSYAFEVSEGVYAYTSSCADDATFQERFKNVSPERLQEWKCNNANALADLDGYNAKLEADMQAKREAYAIQKQKDAEAQAAKEAAAMRQDEAAQADAEALYKTGGRICWARFENACKAHGVDMHMRTIGSGRKSISYIGKGSADVIGRNKVADGIWSAARKLTEKLGAI